MNENKPDPEAVCSDHVDMFIELVECNDCNIYPQATINEHIKQTVLAERARCIKELSLMRKALAGRKNKLDEGTLTVCLSFIQACEIDIQQPFEAQPHQDHD